MSEKPIHFNLQKMNYSYFTNEEIMTKPGFNSGKSLPSEPVSFALYILPC